MTIRPVDARIIGINTNYLTDNDDVRDVGRSYLAALQDLGVKSLRYPGGEKSDAYLWSVPPFTAPVPTLARTGPYEWPSGDASFVQDYTTFIHNPLDFDEFMVYAKGLGAEPTLVVDFDSMYKPATSGGTAPTKQQLEDTAVAWVRYANVTKGYNVKYWEMGNESYSNAYNGGARAADYARDLIEFAQAMKAVDPTINIGANGPDNQYERGDLDQSGYWWQTVLQIAAPEIDFLAIHSYPPWQWGDYDYYRTHTPDFAEGIDSVQQALNDWAPADAGRIRIALTEVGAVDWSSSWPNKNDLGHALVLFDMFGAYLKHPKLDHAQLWNTRWVAITDTTDIFNALDINQNLLPTGRVLSIWGQFLRQNMINTSSTDLIRTFASYTSSTRELSVLVINKDTIAHQTDLSLNNYHCPCRGSQWVLTGMGPQDLSPSWVKRADVALSDSLLSLNLDPVSLTAVALRPQLQYLVWYVAPGGNNANDYRSPATPCATINRVLTKPDFLPGDTIRVAIGTYGGTGNEVVLLDKSAILSGGWNASFRRQSGLSTITGQAWGIRVDNSVTAHIERFAAKNNPGGIINGGTLTLLDSSVSGSTSNGGISNFGTLTVTNSTVNGNQADGGQSGIDNFVGTNLTLINSTVSGNIGAGVYNCGDFGGGGQITIKNSTVTGNSAAGISSCDGTVALQNTILAGNMAGGASGDCSDTITSLGYNLIGTTSNCTITTTTGDLTNTLPLLGPLQDNGGPTLTHALLPDSPAFDAGDNAACPSSDQRGVARPPWAACDIGAYEVGIQADLRVTISDAPDPVNAGKLLTYTLTNAGPSAANGVVLTDTLSASATLNSVTASQGTCSGTTTVVCNVDALSANATVIVTIVVTTPNSAATLLTLASAQTDEIDPSYANSSHTETTTVNLPIPPTGGPKVYLPLIMRSP